MKAFYRFKKELVMTNGTMADLTPMKIYEAHRKRAYMIVVDDRGNNHTFYFDDNDCNFHEYWEVCS